ncbi:hypothetical protein C8J56DRAFT_920619 [Mycena floridula]|nr:hypothetical protein C8J56DRAFT_920619 [Mycena floridula]
MPDLISYEKLLDKYSLNRLPLPCSIICDHIFIYLPVEDILALRRVCKFFFLLTCRPAIWTRFLDDMEIIVPPQLHRPKDYPSPFDFEAEQMVTRALTLDDNWRQESNNAAVFNGGNAISAMPVITEMQILPGGKHIVVSNSISNGHELAHFVILYSLESQADRPESHLVVAQMVSSAAYKLNARYARFEGRPGIMVTFLERSRPFQIILPDDTGVTFSFSGLFISLEALELSETEPKRCSWEPVMYFCCDFPLDDPVMYEVDNKPYVAIVEKPNNIIIVDLDANDVTKLECQINVYDFKAHHISMYHCQILSIQVLASQGQILVVSTGNLWADGLDPTSGSIYVAELYELGEGTRVATSREYINIGALEKVQITKPYPPRPNLAPPPISIFLTKRFAKETELTGIEHYALWPVPGRVAGEYMYQLGCGFLVQQERIPLHLNPFNNAGFIPGTHRSLLYHNRVGGSLHLGRRLSPGIMPDHQPMVPRVAPNDLVRRPSRQKGPHTTNINLQVTEWDDYRLKGKVLAVAFDESTGRVCIADQGDRIVFLDYGLSFNLVARHIDWASLMFPDVLHRPSRR